MEDFSHLPPLPLAPAWSLQVGSTGKILIAISVALFLIGAIVEWIPKLRKTAIAKWAAPLGSVALFGAVICLGTLFAQNRFEFDYVRDHSDLRMGLAYKLAAIWSGQEGSFLLWATMSAVFGGLAARSAGPYLSAYRGVYCAFLAAITAILMYESPFRMELINGQALTPPDGAGLAPTLLNYWVIIHPPTIFAGFGSLTIMFAFAMAAMITKNPTDWISRVRPWALVSLGLLGLGLCMGGFWAYETLGWGGFWGWDPVENTSFVPWAMTAVFTHGILVQTSRKQWVGLNLIFGAAPFLLFVYGTFLTRSGYLSDTSVHSFAEMNSGALKILVGTLLASMLVFGSFFAFGKWRQPKADVAPAKGLVRQPLHVWGNFSLIALAIITGVGMSWPVIQSLFGQKPKVVEEWLYHVVVTAFFIAAMILMALAPFAGWRRTDSKEFWWRVYGIFCLAVGLAGITMFIAARTEFAGKLALAGTIDFPFGIKAPRMYWTLALTAISYFALMGAGWRSYELWKRSKLGISPFLAHAGVAILMAGLILSRGLEQRQEFVVQQGGTTPALGYSVGAGRQTTNDLMDRDNKVAFTLAKNDEETKLFPGFYFLSRGGQLQPMTWPAIHRKPLYDEYLALHQMQMEASDPLTLKPGETKNLDRFTVTYKKMTRVGEPGQAGTKFGALIEVKDVHAGQTYTLNPTIMLTGEGIDPQPAKINDEYFISLLNMEAASQSFTMQLNFTRPLYWVELFVKPFTILVWIGTGILTLGTLLSAYYRRRIPTDSSGNAEAIEDDAAANEKEHALSPVA